MSLGLVLLLSASVLAAPAPSSEFRVDARFELLGVVQRLAGDAGPAPLPEYAAEADAAFAKFASDPAVALYKRLAGEPGMREALAVLPLYYSDPPELRLLDPDADIHYLSSPGAAARAQQFLRELRRFAKETSFMTFYRKHAALYREREEQARAALRGVEPVSAVEAYLGLGLSARGHFLLPLLARGGHDFIVPYPLPPANEGARRFDAYTISSEGPEAFVWPELLSVFLDPSVYYFEKRNVPSPEEFYGKEVAACRAASPSCVKHLLSSALADRLNARAGLRRARPAGDDARYVSALEARLEEYDAARDKYPTLWSFYPRLFSVFYELSHGGAAGGLALAVPESPRPREVADFFLSNLKEGPGTSFKLEARGARRDGKSPSASELPELAPPAGRWLAQAVSLRALAADLGERVYAQEVGALPEEERAAVRALEPALREGPAGSPRVLAALSGACRSAGLTEEARALLARAAAAAPKDPEVRLQQAAMNGDLEPLQELARRSPGDAGARLDVADAALRAGKLDVAREAAAAAAQLPTDEAQRGRLDRLFRELGRR